MEHVWLWFCTPIDLVDGLSNHTDKITIVKHNNGNVYMPEFGFNGIGTWIWLSN